MSIIAPGAFEKAYTLQMTQQNQSYGYTDIQDWQQGRGYGFFLQPNSAAYLSCLLAFTWASLRFSKSLIWDILPITLAGGIVLLTGSRGGLLVFITLFLVFVFIRCYRRSKIVGYNETLGSNVVKSLAVVTISFLMLSLAIIAYSQTQQDLDSRQMNIQERYMSLIGFVSETDTAQSDKSVASRLSVKIDGLKLIYRKPLLGFGLGAMDALRGGDFIMMATHDQFIKFGINYGIFYPFLYMLLIIATAVNRYKYFWNYMGSSLPALLAIYIIISFPLVNVIDGATIYYSVLGVVAMAPFTSNR